MGDVDDLIQRVKEDSKVWQVRIGKERREMKISYNKNFLHDTGVVYEREGLEITRLYLEKKRQARETQYQAEGLQIVLGHIAACPQAVINRAIGRLLIETLVSIPRKGD